MNGVLVVDKPAGPTSHDVVDRVRRAFGVKRAGHTGTLDPFASGVLPVCVGKATRLARFLAAGEKVYRATVRLGVQTTTDDLLGEPLGPARPVDVDVDAVRAACAGLVGRVQQVPPAYSAKRVAGRRLYELARKGLAAERRAVEVMVQAIEVLEMHEDSVELNVSCSSGTYIRALARDLGAILELGGHLTALCRTRNGEFGLEDAVAADQLGPGARDRLLPMSGLLTSLPVVLVGADGERAVCHGRDLGRSLVLAGFPEVAEARFRVMNASGTLLGLAVPRGLGLGTPGLPVEPVLHADVVLA